MRDHSPHIWNYYRPVRVGLCGGQILKVLSFDVSVIPLMPYSVRAQLEKKILLLLLLLLLLLRIIAVVILSYNRSTSSGSPGHKNTESRNDGKTSVSKRIAALFRSSSLVRTKPGWIIN